MTDSHKAYKRALTDMQKGVGIAIFPEATIPECAPNLGPFKNGAFKLAIESQAAIIPVTFRDNWKIFPDKKNQRFLVQPGLSRIIVHRAIPTKGMADHDIPALKEQVRNIIESALKLN